MKLTKRSLAASGLAVLLTSGLVLGYQAGAKRVGEPSRVATVNLSVVMEKLEQRAAAQANLSTMGEKLEGEDTAKKAELTKMQNELKAMTGDTPERDALQEKLALATLQYQGWAEVSTRRLDIEQSLVLKDLYKSIKAAAAQLAQTMKLDLVLVDDSQGEIETDPDARMPAKSQVMQQIAGRRMLFADAAIDVTDDLIARMNNAFKAAGAGNAAAAMPR